MFNKVTLTACGFHGFIVYGSWITQMNTESMHNNSEWILSMYQK